MQHLNDTMKTKHESYVPLVISAKKKVRGSAKNSCSKKKRSAKNAGSVLPLVEFDYRIPLRKIQVYFSS